MKSYIVSVDRADCTENGRIIWRNDPKKTEEIQSQEDLNELSKKVGDIFRKYSDKPRAWRNAYTENNPTLENPKSSYSDIEVSVSGTSFDGGYVRVKAQEKYF